MGARLPDASARNGDIGMKSRRSYLCHQLPALLASFAVFTIPQSAQSQSGDISAASLAAQIASLGSTVAGTNSIANGSQNVATGQQTQNHAQTAMGAMQIAQGILGLLAAAAAAGQSNKGQDNNRNLDSTINPVASNSSSRGNSSTQAATTSNSSLGSSGSKSSENSVQITPEGIRKGELGNALSGIEKAYGIPRDDFVKALQNGVDPKSLLAAAPKNAPSLETLGKIEAGLASLNAKDSEALASGGASHTGASNPLANAGGAGTGSAPSGDNAEGKGTRSPASTASSEESLDDPLTSSASASLSPEVKAALAAKAASIKSEREMKEMHGWSIFQLVNNRYKKLVPMLYGRVERSDPKPVPTEQ
jgi:hypothetical protein